MFFVVALISALASQVEAADPPPPPPPPPAAARSTTQRVLGRRYEPAARAREVCAFSKDNNSLHCNDLARFNVVESSVVDTPTGIALIAAARPGDGCTAALSLWFSLQATEAVSIDWQRSSLDIDGKAQPLLPGFARRITAAVGQRPTVAAAGITISEDAFVDPGGPGLTCIATLRPERAETVIGLHLAISVGGRDDVAHISQRFAWEPLAEAGAIALLDVPADVVEPDAPPLPLALIGGVSGGVVGAGIGAVIGVVSAQGSSGVGAGVGAGLCCGVTLAGGLAAIAVIPLAVIETDQRRQFDKAEAQRRQRRTLLARRAALGIEAPQVQAH